VSALKRRRISLWINAISPSFVCRVGPGGSHHGEEGVSEHGQQRPAASGGPGADLVFVQGGELLAGLERFFDRPTAAGDSHQCGQLCLSWCVGAIERQLAGADGAPDQQLVLARGAGHRGVGCLDPGPVVQPLAFGGRVRR
jgi:hypothetical protein